MALKSAQELSKLITAIGRIGKKIDEQIQVAAIQAIGYSIVHGDIRFGQQLFDNMPSGARRQALVTYLEKFGQFVWMSTEKKFNFYKRDDIEFDEEFLAGRKWYDEKKENIVSDIDVQAMVDKLIKRIESAIEKVVSTSRMQHCLTRSNWHLLRTTLNSLKRLWLKMTRSLKMMSPSCAWLRNLTGRNHPSGWSRCDAPTDESQH